MYKSKQTPSDLMAFFSIFQELSHSKVVTGTREDLNRISIQEENNKY